MSDPLLVLIDERSALLRQVAELGDFQPGSISSPTMRCGKPSCHCAKPDDPGHGPYYQLTAPHPLQETGSFSRREDGMLPPVPSKRLSEVWQRRPG